MPEINLQWNIQGGLSPEDDDDRGNFYLLGRQVMHEYHHPAVQMLLQNPIDAESAAQQSKAQGQKTEKDELKEKESEATSEFAAGMMESFQRRQAAGSKELQPAHGAAPAPELQPSHVTAQQKSEVEKETQGVEAPMLDPTQAAAAGFGAMGMASINMGMKLMPSLARAMASAGVSAATDFL